MNSGRSLPERIDVHQRRGFNEPLYSVTIDGEQFPWHIAAAGISTTVSESELPSITLTILAHHVNVIDEWPA